MCFFVFWEARHTFVPLCWCFTSSYTTWWICASVFTFQFECFFIAVCCSLRIFRDSGASLQWNGIFFVRVLDEWVVVTGSDAKRNEVTKKKRNKELRGCTPTQTVYITSTYLFTKMIVILVYRGVPSVTFAKEGPVPSIDSQEPKTQHVISSRMRIT